MKTCYLLIVFLLILFAASCPNGANPVVPDGMDNKAPEFQIIVSESSDATNEPNLYRGVFGAWKVHVDTENMTAEIIPARNAKAIGDIFDADLSQFLTVSPCANCLNITGLRIETDDLINLGVTMKHPFGNITARPDLHGFDVRAIFLMDYPYFNVNDLEISKPDGSTESIVYNAWWLLNSDGYTSHYDELVGDDRYFAYTSETPTNISPYLRFFEDRSTGDFDPHAPSGYNVMPVDSPTYTRTAVLYPYSVAFAFYIVADVAYGHSATYTNRDNPQYYLPEYNRTEPWRMEYWIDNNTLSSTDANSSADVVVQVFDWQHNATVDANYPDPANPSGISESSKVTQVELLMPSLSDDPVIATVPDSGTGTPTDPLQYTLNIKNEKLSSANVVYGLVAVRDELHGQTGRFPVPEVPAGFPYATLDIKDYSYYGEIRINIPDNGWTNEYNNELTVTDESRYTRLSGKVDATFFMDPSHKKFEYKWDLDYDGYTFDIDESNLPMPWTEFNPGKTDVGLRVRTHSKPPQEYIYTIPVYRQGEEYFKRMSVVNDTDDTTSTRRNHAIGVAGDRFYYAFTAKRHGNIEVYLGDIKRDGDTRVRRISDSIGDVAYEPAIAVVEDGADAGIYMVFTVYDNGDKDLYATHGDFEGIGLIANIVAITDTPTTASESQPCLLYHNGTLLCYYKKSTILSKINVTKSIDSGQTWTDNTIIDNSTGYQNNPTVGYCEYFDSFFCVWEDYRNALDYGADLYCAVEMDGDGLDFDYSINLSTSRENIDDTLPSISVYDELVAVAYIQRPVGETATNLYLKTLVRGSGYPCMDYQIMQGVGYNCKFGAPAISSASEGVFSIAYNGLDMDNDEYWISIHQYEERQTGIFGLYQIHFENYGVLSDTNGYQLYPAVLCRRAAGGYAVENFTVFKTYEEGLEKVSTPITKYFGQIDVISHISSGDEYLD
jgi:hypothetical protein